MPRLRLALTAVLICFALQSTTKADPFERSPPPGELTGSPASKGPPPDEVQIYVQLGAFRKPDGAARLASELNGLGYDVSVIQAPDFQRVVTGPFADEAEAGSTLNELQRKGYEGYLRRIAQERPRESPQIASGRAASSLVLYSSARTPKPRSRPEGASTARPLPDLAEALEGRSTPTPSVIPASLPVGDRGDGLYGEAARGSRVLEDRHCTSCHSMGSADRYSAPSLGRRPRHPISPSGLTAALWNHAPILWRNASRENRSVQALSQQQMRDLYSYFFALRYFDPFGDAAEGKRVFSAKGCDQCHDVKAGGTKRGPPAPGWRSLNDPSLWVARMGSHRPIADPRLRQRNDLTVHEMADLLVYLENLTGRPKQNRAFSVNNPDAGESLFESRGCTSCHTVGRPARGKIDLLGGTWKKKRPLLLRLALFRWLPGRSSSRPAYDRSLSGLAVALWNHPRLIDRAGRDRKADWRPFQPNEMADLLAYFIQQGYFAPPGDASRGRKLFHKKTCETCHKRSSRLALTAGDDKPGFTEVSLAAAPWMHEPPQLRKVPPNKAWPTLTERDVSDLIAYIALDSKNRRQSSVSLAAVVGTP